MYWIEILTCICSILRFNELCNEREEETKFSSNWGWGYFIGSGKYLFHFMVRTAWLTNHLRVQLNLDILNIVIMYFINMSQLSWKFQPLFVLILKTILNPWIFSSIFMVIKFEITYEIFFKAVFASC